MLSDGLTNSKLNFIPSQIDPCVFYRKDCIILTYVDDCIILSKDLKVISNVVEYLKQDFDVELEESIDGGDIADFLVWISLGIRTRVLNSDNPTLLIESYHFWRLMTRSSIGISCRATL